MQNEAFGTEAAFRTADGCPVRADGLVWVRVVTGGLDGRATRFVLFAVVALYGCKESTRTEPCLLVSEFRLCKGKRKRPVTSSTLDHAYLTSLFDDDDDNDDDDDDDEVHFYSA